MEEIFSDANRRIEFAKSLLHQAKIETRPDVQLSLLEIAIVSAFSSLEGFLTYTCSHFTSRSSDFTIFERSIISERAVKLTRGRPVLAQERFQSVDDRLQFLFWKFSGKEFDTTKAWWSDFVLAVKIRNNIMHPKKNSNLTIPEAERCVLSIILAIEDLVSVVFGSKWPKSKKGLVPNFEI